MNIKSLVLEPPQYRLFSSRKSVYQYCQVGGGKFSNVMLGGVLHVGRMPVMVYCYMSITFCLARLAAEMKSIITRRFAIFVM